MSSRECIVSPRFERELKLLNRKYKGLEKEAHRFLQNIATDGPPSQANRIQGVSGVPVYKSRIPVLNLGRRGGARIIYYCSESCVAALCIYVKNAKADIPTDEIKRALAAIGA